jgi:ABC-type multidrug transport system ATPase subunit
MEKLTISMQQKVAAARALLRRPRLLLLDETARGLDSDSKKVIHQLIREIQTENGVTVIYVTQDAQEAYALCDRIAHLEAGKLVDFDLPAAPDPRGLLDDAIPAHSTAEFAQSIAMSG